MQIRLYIDEDAMSRALVAGLRARGIDATTVIDEGKAGLTDLEQLEFAHLQGRVLYTSNTSDFFRLHTEFAAESKPHAGIVFVPQQRYGIGEQVRRLLKLIQAKTAEDMRNHVEFLSSWG